MTGAPERPPARLSALGSPRVARLLREIAVQQASEAERIANTMLDAYVSEIPAYSQISDPTLRDDVHAVSAAMVRAWLMVLFTGEPVGPDALAPLLQGARRRAAQGIDLQSLLRAFRVGVRVMWSELVSTPEWNGTILQGASVHLAEWALDFADRVSTGVAGAYMDELAHVAREREHRRSALLNVILGGPAGETFEGPAELEQPHAVVVASVEEDLALDELEHLGDALEAGVGALLWTIRHRSVVVAVPLAEPRARDRLRRQLPELPLIPGSMSFGLGGNARGSANSRHSYREAVESLRMGPLLTPAGSSVGHAVFDYQDLAPAISLMEHPAQARRFVATSLEVLGELVERPWVLPTVEAYLGCQSHLKETAARLGVHLSTVKYRLRELRPALDVLADGDRASTFLLAVRMRRVLGGQEP